MRKPWLTTIGPEGLRVDELTAAPAIEDDEDTSRRTSYVPSGVPIAPSRRRSEQGSPQSGSKGRKTEMTSTSPSRPPIRRSRTETETSRGFAISDIINFRTRVDLGTAKLEQLLNKVFLN
jgi:hypothetical protein